VQDEGSQIAASMVAPPPSGQVLDLCAGAGGKTLALAAALGNRGQIFASDRDRGRLAPIFARLKRAGTRNVQVRPAGAPLDDLVGRMDVVLVDAPCTGSGTWRRRPDAKWRLSERALGDRMAEQRVLLPEAARYVAPGGRLVYVTCSLLSDEDDETVSAFQAVVPGFVSVSAHDAIAANLPPALGQAVLTTRHGVMLTPLRAATDGFYVAVLRRELDVDAGAR
jgi:16S rRNA (cytosine967-C5)-methyltransferase